MIPRLHIFICNTHSGILTRQFIHVAYSFILGESSDNHLVVVTGGHESKRLSRPTAATVSVSTMGPDRGGGVDDVDAGQCGPPQVASVRSYVASYACHDCVLRRCFMICCFYKFCNRMYHFKSIVTVFLHAATPGNPLLFIKARAVVRFACLVRVKRIEPRASR